MTSVIEVLESLSLEEREMRVRLLTLERDLEIVKLDLAEAMGYELT